MGPGVSVDGKKVHRLRMLAAAAAVVLACANSGTLASASVTDAHDTVAGRHSAGTSSGADRQARNAQARESRKGVRRPRKARAQCSKRRKRRTGKSRKAKCAKRHHARRHAAHKTHSHTTPSSAGKRSTTKHRSKTHHAKHHATKHSSVTVGQAKPATPPIPLPTADGSCPDSFLTPKQGNLDRIRTATLCLINQERIRHDEAPLRASDQLEKAAQRHTDDMVGSNYFDHIGPHGDTPLSRVRDTGYIYSPRVGYVVGENIAWGTLGLATPHSIVMAWIASPEHLANILDQRFRDTAIGVDSSAPPSLAKGQAGAIYTQDFGVIITG
jgi:uncharacterized protein YkwD